MNQLAKVAQHLRDARQFAQAGDDNAARGAYVDALRLEPTHLEALSELGTSAFEGGFRSAARTAFEQAALHHPNSLSALANLGQLLLLEGDLAGARSHFEGVLAVDPHHIFAHQGMARALTLLGENGRAQVHRAQGFEGHAVVQRPYRGDGSGRRVLMLASTGGGNVPMDHLLDNRLQSVTVCYPEFLSDHDPLPDHDVVLNTIGDADCCDIALSQAEKLVARSTAPIINHPTAVRKTRRFDIARRLGRIAGVRAPAIFQTTRSQLATTTPSKYPRLLRSPGFHTGQHFCRLENETELEHALTELSGEDILDIECLDARRQDGLFHKFRVMLIDQEIFPLHLAVSKNWKVHYFSADMADSPILRDQERSFLDQMEAVIGRPALKALSAIAAELGLDYVGVDFARSQDGELLLFEANATMVILPPGPETIWDYRRAPIGRALDAAKALLGGHNTDRNPTRVGRTRKS